MDKIPKKLQAFCSKDGRKRFSEQPFYIDGYTYASDGYIIIRIAGEYASFMEDAPKAHELGAWKNLNKKTPDFILRASRLASIQKTVEVCPHCSPDVKTFLCPECNMEEWFDGSCKLCHGNEYITLNTEDCWFCKGSQWAKMADWQIGWQIFNVQYLSKITQAFGDLKIYVDDYLVPSVTPPIAFRFDGGEGLLMPCRGDLDNAINREGRGSNENNNSQF